MPPSYSRASKPSQPQALTPLKRTAAGLSASISKENSPSRAQAIAAGGARPSAKRFKSVNGAPMACPSTTSTTLPSQHQLALPEDKAGKDRGGGGGGGGEKESATAASLASKKEREAKQASLARDEEEFVSKYTKAFPSFVFHFDSVQPGPAEGKILDLGGRIDKFFSKYVTHVISSRPVPVPNDKENAPPSAKAALAAAESSRRAAVVDSRTMLAASRVSKPPVNPFLDEGGPSDVLQKAVSFKMKVWDLKKLNSVLSRLATSSKPSTSRTTTHRPSQSSLSHLLADEKIHGTRERDLSAPRPDYHYFTKGSFFILCEDATGEYRTVLAKEYDRPRGGEAPEWPVLHGNFLKASTSAPVKMEPVEPKLPPLQKKTSTTAATASASKVPIGLSAKTRLAAVRETAGDLRRSASLNNLSKTAKLIAEEERLLALANEGPNDEAGVDRPYIAASGNSVGITSTITSAQSGTGHGGGGNNAAAMKRDQRRVVELPRKVVPVVSGLRGLAPSRMTDQSKVELLPSASITERAVDEDQRMIDLDSTPAEADEDMAVVEEGEGDSVWKGRGDAAPAPAVESRKRKHMVDHVHRTLAVGDPKGKVAGRMDPPPPIKKRYSFPGALPRREKSMVRLPPREENKKPGYCENCRIKFDDFSEHIVSRKHRRFALNTAHFKDLDTVLDRLVREPVRRAPVHVAPPPFKPAVRRPESDSEDEASSEEEEDDGGHHQQQEAEQSEDVDESDDGADGEEVVPQWVLEEHERDRQQLSEEARLREAEEEEVDEIDEDEESDDPLELDMGDEDEE